LLISSTNVSTGVLSTSFPNLTHKHQSIICHQLLLPLLHCHQLLRLMLRYHQLLLPLLHCHRLLRLMLRYRQLLPLLQLRHDYHDDYYDDRSCSGDGFYVRTRTADLTSLS
jgi:hypothetical protein